jgi:hypothetical protein
MNRAPKTNPPATIVTKQEMSEIIQSSSTPEVPLDPAWEIVRETTAQLKLVGRLFLRGQVKLGMLLSHLKKQHCQHGGERKTPLGQIATWSALVKEQTGYSRRSADVFIALFESTKTKLRTAKNLNIPAPVKKDAIAIFKAENPLALTDDQWAIVDQVIGTLTDGETQASLMQDLGLIPAPKAMPAGKRKTDTDEPTAGQLAFHFFEAIASPLINGRTNPDYKKLLLALPLESSEAHPLSLSSLEAEYRAALADIEDAKRHTAKPTTGRVITKP